MSTYDAPEQRKSGLPVPAVIAAVVVAIALLGYSAYKSFGPPEAPTMTPAALQKMARYEELAKKTKGDITKLTPEEQSALMKETGGHGGQMLANIAKQKGYDK